MDWRERRRADEFEGDRAGATFSIGPQSRQRRTEWQSDSDETRRRMAGDLKLPGGFYEFFVFAITLRASRLLLVQEATTATRVRAKSELDLVSTCIRR